MGLRSTASCWWLTFNLPNEPSNDNIHIIYASALIAYTHVMTRAIFTPFPGLCSLPAPRFHHLCLIIPLAAPVFKVTLHSWFVRLPELSLCQLVFSVSLDFWITNSSFPWFWAFFKCRFLDCSWIFFHFFFKFWTQNECIIESFYLHTQLRLQPKPSVSSLPLSCSSWGQ